MTLFGRQILTIFIKDLRIALRHAESYLSVVLFGFLLLLLFNFALNIDPELMRRLAPGLFWLTTLFASLLTLEHSFQSEVDDGQWEGLLLFGANSRALFLGKMGANLFFVLLLQMILIGLVGILFDLFIPWKVVGILFLGSFGISTLGTFYAGLTANLRGAQTLLPLLLFPMLIPLLLSAVKATELSLAPDLFGQQAAWLQLLIIFDTVFFLGSLLAAEALFDRS